MVQNLQIRGILWKDAGDIAPEKIDELVKKDKRGYLLDVVVKYPKELYEITMSCHFSRENEN